MRGWLFVCLLSSLAGAQEDPDTQAAKRHFENGRALYEEGRTEERRENWAAACDAYQKYLQEQPDAPDAAELQKRILVLRARTQPPTTPAPKPPAKRSRLHLAAVGLLAVTAIAAGLGSVMVGTVDGGFQDLAQTCTFRQCGPGDWASLQARANAGYAFVGIAATAAVADVVLWIVDYRRGKTTMARATGLGVRF